MAQVYRYYQGCWTSLVLMMTTRYLNKYVFKRLCAGRYPIVIMIIDSTYGFVHRNVCVKRIQEMLEEYITWDVK